MEAKDTVMTGGKLCALVCREHRDATLEGKDCDGLDCEDCQLTKQAEITWTIAYGLGHTDGSYKGEEEGNKAGMREVVEIIKDFQSMFCQDFDKKYGVSSTVGHTPKGLLEVLNRIAKLKEWGI